MKSNLDRLQSVIGEIGPLAVAVSGGVDSMTLAVVAHRTLGSRAHMLHAVSPAVPEEATRRVLAYAKQNGWRVDVIDAHEFSDANYLENPHDRCFYCKTNLYSTMADLVDCALASGTNRDDLSDYRPGLKAAAVYGVVSPEEAVRKAAAYVENIYRNW